MITNGYLKSTVHAVQHPPPDQDKFNRLALLYFPRLADDIEILPAPSPLLERIGLGKEEEKPPIETPVRGEGKSLKYFKLISPELRLLVGKKSTSAKMDESANQGL